MQQLINRYDSRVRLLVVEAEEKGGWIYWKVPTPVGELQCIWNGKEWRLEDYVPKAKACGESLEFRTWLAAQLKERGFSASGVCEAMGMSHTWLWNILRGKRRIAGKRVAELERALEMKEGTIARALRTKSPETPTIREDV